MPVIEDGDELEILFQDVVTKPEKNTEEQPRLGIRTAVARFNYIDSVGGDFGFLAGDKIILYDNVNELFWEGLNLRTGLEEKFEHLYVQLEDVPSEEENGKPAPETICSINEREVNRIRKAYARRFGAGLDPIVAFRVMRTIQDSFKSIPYDDLLACLSMVYPRTTQWLSLLTSEIETFSKFINEHWRYLGLFDYSVGKLRFEDWPDGCEQILHYGPAYYKWNPTLRRCRMSLPNVEAIWDALKTELLGIEELEDWFDLKDITQRIETILGRFRSSLDAMNSADEEWKRQFEQAEKERARKSQLSFQSQDIDLEAGKITPLATERHRARNFRRGAYNLWSTTLAALGTPYGVIYTVVSFATFGGVTTALATWECNPPESTPTVDSNFWSTLTSSSIGTAGLFCTIIPMLRNQKIKVGNERLFHQLLWASLVLAVASSVVYLYQTRASLVLLYLSSATQLATTLQIIYGAVERIEEDMRQIEEDMVQIEGDRMRIEDLERRVVANDAPVA